MRIESVEFLKLIKGARTRDNMLARVMRAAKVRNVAEIGVWRGAFAGKVLRQCPSIRRYYMVDPWAHLPDWNKPYNLAQDVFDGVYKEAIKKTECAASKRVVLRGRTSEVIDAIPDGSLDFAFIDGDHTLRGITIDLVRLLPKMREGGLIAGDDFMNEPHHGERFEPTLVCPFAVYFAEAMDLPIVALPFKQFIIQRRRNARYVFVDPTGKYRDLSVRKNMPVTAAKPARS